MRNSFLQPGFAVVFCAALSFSIPCLADDEIDINARSEALAAEVDRLVGSDWNSYIRGFRKEHSFSLVSGVSSGQWSVRGFGEIENQSFDSSGFFTKFQYTFHLPIYRGFGYLLGSSLGYHLESVPSDQSFQPAAGMDFPGLIAGIVLNGSPKWRVFSAADIYLERWDRIRVKGDEVESQVSVTAQVFDIILGTDFFFGLSWALRLEGHWRSLRYTKPAVLQNVSALDIGLSKSDRWLAVGISHHLL